MSETRVRSLLSEMERFASYPIPSGVMSIPVKDVAERLRRAVDAPDTPTIIRTAEELEALDPDTLLSPREALPMTWQPRDLLRFKMQGGAPLPAVVITNGEQVRAARKALEEA